MTGYSDDPLQRLTIAWMVSPTLFTDNLMDRIRGWRRRCLAQHPKCRGTRGPQSLPSRVIDVSTETTPHTVKLHETRGESGIYAALSYCWGSCSQRTTTKSTLLDHLAGIPISVLPATIQDAIKLCRSLGIPYLWVDSLCIIQDDSEDWRHEAAEMAAIYGRSALTISTPQNSHCDESFNNLNASQPEGPSLPEMLWKHRRHGEAVTGTVTVRRMSLNSSGKPQSSFSTGKQGSPWMTRGWTLQEWLLSPRVLHCGNERMWDCYQTWYSESCLIVRSSSAAADDFDSIGDDSVSHVFARMARLDPDIRGSTLDTHWARLVEDFTYRTLSRQTDKLPAIAGLATKFMEHNHSKALRAKYLAGLWYYKGIYPFEGKKYPTSQIPLGLLWRRSGVDYMRSPAAYRAPSWSWAALDGPVSLFRLDWLLFDMFKTNEGFKAVDKMEILTAKCVYDSPDSCSQVQTGWIIARSPLKRVYIDPSGNVSQFHTDLQNKYHNTFIGLGTERKREQTPWFGILDQSPEQTGIHYVDESLYLLQVATVTHKWEDRQVPDIIHHALLVEKVGNINDVSCFRRLGVAWYSPVKASEIFERIDRSLSEWSNMHMLEDWEHCKVRLI